MNSAREKPTSGAWIFVSHSNKDIEKVRKIRNLLERRGENPVLFFLKCMQNSEADDRLLWDLIEREIKARTFFLLCDSTNAKQSVAVQREKDLAESMLREGKVIKIIDLEKVGLTDEELTDFDTVRPDAAANLSDEQTELQKVIQLSKRATVFLSYAHSDHALAKRIGDALRNHDYGVWTDAELRPGSDWATGIEAAINEAVQYGLVLLLLSEASLQSPFCRRENLRVLERAAESGRSNVVPVIVSRFDRSAIPRELQSIQWFDLTTGSFEARMEELIRNLKRREMA